MDIENLNRTQIILLTLLVSFVTSIATGIVTVSLIQQAPPGVTQTINRVVEHTVEKIVPSITNPGTVTKETTVVVKEDDLVTASIDKNSKSVVGVFEKTMGTDGQLHAAFIGWGVVITNKGVIATDSGLISDSGIYAITVSDGKSFDAKVLNQDEDLGIALIEAALPEKYTLAPVVFGDADKLRLGQSVISFGGKERQAVSIGSVSALTPVSMLQAGTTTTVSLVGFIDASAPPPDGVRGGALINIFGEVLGMSVGDKTTRFISENLIRQKLTALQSEVKKAGQ